MEQELLALGAQPKPLAKALALLQLKERDALLQGLQLHAADAGVALGLEEMRQLFGYLAQ